MRNFKKWLGIFFGTILFFLIMIIVLVIVVDPFFQYHKPLKNFPYLIDNQLSQNPGMAKNMEYDSVILGSSMVANFETKWFQDILGLNTVKLSYSGAYPKDQANIMELIFQSKNQVKKVFLGIDVLTYSADIEETKYPIPKYLYDDKYWNDISYVLNKDVVLNYILRPMADPKDKTDLSTVYQLWWTDEYFKKDLVLRDYIEPEQVEEEVPREGFEEAVEANMETNILPYIETNPDTEFIIFYPPYSILYWNNMIKENRLEATIREYEYISERLLEYDNVRLFLFSGKEDIITDLNNYADYTHHHKDVNYYMTQCFKTGECEITKDNLKVELSKMRTLALNYDFASLLRR